MPSTDSVSYALSDDKGNLLTLPEHLLGEENELSSFLFLGRSGFARSGSWLYSVDRARIPDSDFTVSCIMKVTSPRQERMQVAAMLCLILLGTLLLALICIGICTRNISIPADRLRNRLARIAENDLSPDPELEQLLVGFAQMGATVNQMTVSIQGLMEQAVAEANAKKDSEIAALQSQIYPHFIYNTLDSIHWMAKLQKEYRHLYPDRIPDGAPAQSGAFARRTDPPSRGAGPAPALYHHPVRTLYGLLRLRYSCSRGITGLSDH